MEIQPGLNLVKGGPPLKSGSRKVMGCGVSSRVGAGGTCVYGPRSTLACLLVCSPSPAPLAVCSEGD